MCSEGYVLRVVCAVISTLDCTGTLLSNHVARGVNCSEAFRPRGSLSVTSFPPCYVFAQQRPATFSVAHNMSLYHIVSTVIVRRVPESPSWLLVNDRMEEAKTVLLNISHGNKTPLARFELRTPEEKRFSKNLLSLFSFPVIAVRTTILLVCW